MIWIGKQLETKCSSKSQNILFKGVNATVWAIVLRGLKMVAGVGLNFEGQDVLCGDYIYSGHTIVLSLSALFIAECKFLPADVFIYCSLRSK